MLETKKLIVLDKYIQEVTDNEIIPAVNLSILTKRGNWMCSHGKKQILPLSSPNSLDTLYDISSLTMPYMTATLILKLLENDEINLDDKVNKYLSKFKESTTIIECLTHTSGIEDLSDSLKMTKENILKNIMNIKVNKKLKGKYNESWINYFLLGLIIENLKEGIDVYANEIMFEPMKMKRTFYDPEIMLKSNCACSHIVEGSAVCGDAIDKYALLFDGKAGHAGVFITLQDLSYYVTTMINKGVFRDKVFFKEEQYNLLLNEYKDTGHTLSWIKGKKYNPIKELVSDDALFYSGNTGCSVLIEPVKGYGMVFLSNPFHLNRDKEKFTEVLKETLKLAIDSINLN